jgi:hypothetical protein
MTESNTFNEIIELPKNMQTTQTASAYIVQYEEDVWKGLSEETQQYCKDTWIEFATPLGLDEVVLRLIPDPVFPGFGKEKPYIEWRHKFPKDLGGDWFSTCTVVLNTNDHRDRLDAEGQDQMRSYFSAYPKGTRFIVKNLNHVKLWEHTT